METTQIQNPLEENQEMYIQNSQCEKFVKLSKDMWKNPIKGFAIKYSIKTVNNIFKSFRFEIQKENIDEIVKMISKGNEDLKKYLNDIISLKDTSYTIQMLILLYFFSGIANLLGDRFIIFLILNVLLFYVPLDKNFPHFLFNIFIVCKQYFEGILGIIICLIPKYEDKKEDEIPEKKNQ